MGRLLTTFTICLALASCSGFWRWNDNTRASRTHARAPIEPADLEERVDQYVVKRGDTLYSISFRHHLDYHAVAAWNHIGSDYALSVGQVLRLTPSGAAPSAPVASRPRPATPPPPSPSPPATEPINKAAPLPTEAAPLERYYQWQWPLRGAIAKTYSPEGGSKGLDIVGELGQAVIAAAPGRVVYSGSGLKGYGELVIIKHDETYLSAYGNNRKRLVEEGDLVKTGQQIAELGLGPQQKPLLHFEIRERGRPLDPLPLLPALPK